jgi:hypothetical protein
MQTILAVEGPHLSTRELVGGVKERGASASSTACTEGLVKARRASWNGIYIAAVEEKFES